MNTPEILIQAVPSGVTFENKATITLRHGLTGEVKEEIEIHNDISDDFLCSYTSIFSRQADGGPYCFLLPDGAAWSSFTWDRTNPWAPYCYSMSNASDSAADPYYMDKTLTQLSYPTRFKCFYRWTKLPQDLALRAIGLTFWTDEVAAAAFGVVNNTATVFMPQTLIVLPSALTVKGRNLGLETPDTLEVSYYLSAVGVN